MISLRYDMQEAIHLLNDPIKVSEDFLGTQHNYFFFSKLLEFNQKTLEGTIQAIRYRRKIRLSFDQEMLPFEKTDGWEFPDAYGNDKKIFFKINIPNRTTCRFTFDGNKTKRKMTHAVPLVAEHPELLEGINEWTVMESGKNNITYASDELVLSLYYDPFKVVLSTRKGEVLIDTISIHEKIGLMNDNPIPCGFIQKTGTEEREFVFSSSIQPNERFFGCGESFTRLNKRGQILHISSNDPKGVSTKQMYKPVPFFLSDKNYGCFVYSTYPMSFDFGSSYDGVQSIFVKEHCLDLVVFTGSPKQIVSSYTNVTGKSPMLPEWSFGLWMGRITYNSRKEVEEVARNLKKYDIPCDVIHIDTGWFEEDWKCDFQFSQERFNDVKGMIDSLHTKGFHISLWQLPYVTPENPLFEEILENGYAITQYDDGIPTEDAILDLTNEATIKWYQAKLKQLLALGIDVIKADFGEAAPYNGVYANGRSGISEHNVFPLRYNKTVSEVTANTKGHPMIWARSGWAGSQRYPLHWGGDAENTNCAMAATLRAGLSLGLCGFTFWSHDIGGFVKSPYPDLYLRWLAFGMFSSHARCHGNPPKEPWEYSESFMEKFRELVKMRYALMPYILAQAKESSEKGWPLIRTLFFEIPEDEGCWNIEDEYFFGSQLLVAPIFYDNTNHRKVYLPAGYRWRDYFTDTIYDGGSWKDIATTQYIIVLKRESPQVF
ncbi:MAG: alpha-xylosidase [Sphaerochaetaceae bacterium]